MSSRPGCNGDDLRFLGMVCVGISSPAMVMSFVSLGMFLTTPVKGSVFETGYDAESLVHLVSGVAARLVFSALSGTALSFFFHERHVLEHTKSRTKIALLLAGLLVFIFGSVLLMMNKHRTWAMNIIVCVTLFSGTLSVPVALLSMCNIEILFKGSCNNSSSSVHAVPEVLAREKALLAETKEKIKQLTEQQRVCKMAKSSGLPTVSSTQRICDELNAESKAEGFPSCFGVSN
uniref:Uncharacterized protein n=1 Tax=Mucochytrium quahogii TaxID=96639 RepID=A0A7S2WSQ9_9STRA|mmetsp:Transcript_9560/g.15657  ORF Transcript_9560/g.15657 Transcript_9560/m.15657 type:complete len:233 (+) Transcript_9560:79-777(+)|eukprot:CAMPEP_0203772834 /NCGR_PEP_ID=MMETSP0099_2-20121227/4285_1 /ASSEMBLY_ACC=CAM_ASM_000209 /TAXON_ID=96639 /ORGANISM=" , Strain NY0313808BC1" /LENGTH=232 /DNA_ID=CAMNT_0050670523 /DNA_START=35 /DNA_END=733 /DNA_ORIENTATION=+